MVCAHLAGMGSTSRGWQRGNCQRPMQLRSVSLPWKLLPGRRRLSVRPAAFGAMPSLVACGARARAAASSRQQPYIRTSWSNARTSVSRDSIAVQPFGERTSAPSAERGGAPRRTQTPTRRETDHPRGVPKQTQADSRRAVNWLLQAGSHCAKNCLVARGESHANIVPHRHHADPERQL
jgi:hypothetical protein